MNSNRKLLVVDDCQSTRAIIRDILKGKELEILESTNGNEAIAMVMKEHPSLVLLDISLPEKDGLDVLEELLEENFSTPIVIISSDVTVNTKKTCASLGVKEYLEKPLDAERLRETVERYLRMN